MNHPAPLFPSQLYLQSVAREGVALKKMPSHRPLQLLGLTEASLLDASVHDLAVYVADAARSTVDVLKVGDDRSRQGLPPVGQVLKLTVGLTVDDPHIMILYDDVSRADESDHLLFFCRALGFPPKNFGFLFFLFFFLLSLAHQGERVTALALDWVTSNLYWSSSLRPHVHVTSRQGGHTALLLQGALQVLSRR